MDRPQLDIPFANAVQRYTLVQPNFHVVADGESYTELTMMAPENGAFDYQMEGGQRGRDLVDPSPAVRPIGGGTDNALPALHACYGKPGQG